jgi:outer membrane lipoprotein-sorting protein
MKISDGSESYEVKFDGKDYPAGGDSHSTVSLKLIDEYTLEEIDKRDGKVITIARMTVSKDGTAMRVESSDKQRGSTMTYTAERRP